MLTRQIEIALPKLHEAQAEVKSNATRFNLLDCGRRWGKNVFGEDIAIEAILQGQPVGWFEPTYKTLSDVWREVKNITQPITRHKSEQEKRIETVTGGTLEMWSLDNPDASRGRKYKRVIINEAAIVKDLGGIWNMVIRPMLADLAGDGWVFSTPKGRNYFWQMYRMGIDPENTDWSAWMYSTYANPHIPKAEIDAMRDTMPERIFAQEIMAEFLDDAGGVFRRVMETATATEQDEPEQDKDGNQIHQYIAGVDVASLVDFTVCVVIDVTTKEMVYMDRFNRVDYTVLEERLAATYKRFNLSSMTVEDNSIGRPVIDHLVQKDLSVRPFTTTNATKHSIIQRLQSAFEHNEIKILNDPVLIGELQAYEAKRNTSGTFSYSAPAGMHDDTVMALAIAWDGIATPSGASLVSFG